MAEKKTTQAQQAHSGPAEPMRDTDAEAAEIPVPRETLDRRQAALSQRRRPGGPPLEDTEESVSVDSMPNEPQTDCAPPPKEKTRR
jgi:hypothetical protein